MLSIDTNILFAAFESTAPNHADARRFLATVNTSDFRDVGFRRVWNPLMD